VQNVEAPCPFHEHRPLDVPRPGEQLAAFQAAPVGDGENGGQPTLGDGNDFTDNTEQDKVVGGRPAGAGRRAAAAVSGTAKS
jgi:hypothetical protein